MSATGREWDADHWISQFQLASRDRDHHWLHALRASVFDSTVQVVRARGYSVDAAQVSLDSTGEYEALHRGTRFYEATDELVVPASRRSRYETAVSVVDGDCLEVARRLSTDNEAPAVLNMASRRNPGGGVRGGAGAQEENLFRRSNLLWSLYQFKHYAEEYGVPRHPAGLSYPIPRESGGIYSPPTAVFRSSEAAGYAFLPQPYQVAFLTVPAIPNPDTNMRDGLPWLTPAMADATRRKLRAILRIGAHHDHADLVLSAFGCGAFRNPPHHMAQLFGEVLQEPEFDGVFRYVTFAILNDHNAFHGHNPRGNHEPFVTELERAGLLTDR